MVFCPKKSGKPRRTVDLQLLNRHTARKTYHSQSPFRQARMIPPDTHKLYSMPGIAITSCPSTRTNATSQLSSHSGAVVTSLLRFATQIANAINVCCQVTHTSVGVIKSIMWDHVCVATLSQLSLHDPVHRADLPVIPGSAPTISSEKTSLTLMGCASTGTGSSFPHHFIAKSSRHCTLPTTV